MKNKSNYSTTILLYIIYFVHPILRNIVCFGLRILSIFLLFCFINNQQIHATSNKNSNKIKNVRKDKQKEIETVNKKTSTSGKENIKEKHSNSLKTNEKKIKEKKANKNEVEASKQTKQALEKEKKLAKWIEKTIDYSIHKERKRAINYILTIKNENLKIRLEKKLVSIIKNELDFGVKIKAITVAGELELKEAVPEIKKSLDDESEDVKISAIYALKKIGDLSVKPDLIKKLKEQDLDKNSTYTEALIDTLGKFKAVELQSYAIDSIMSDKTTKNLRELFVLFLGRIGSKDSKDSLIQLLKDDGEDQQIRAFAANSLASLDVKEAAKDIDEIITTIESYSFKKKKKYNSLYLYCLAALAKLGDEQATPRLMNSLKSDNAVVRARSIKLLKELADKRAIDILKYKMEYDPSPKVQKAAKEALEEMGVDTEIIETDNISTAKEEGDKEEAEIINQTRNRNNEKKSVKDNQKSQPINKKNESK